MIHYHGTPLGGRKLDPSDYLRGRHGMISFHRPDNLATALDVCQSIALDNGAFSLWRAGGGDVDVEAYHRWVHSVAGHPALDWCLLPDKIDGTEAENIDLVTLSLRLGWRVKVVPIWHLNESLDWLGYLVSNFQRVALGSSGQWSTPGTAAWWARMAEAMAVACDEHGRARTRLHGLRMLDPSIFQHLPLSSADSANAAVNSGDRKRFGTYVDPYRGERAATIARTVEIFQSSPVWVEPPQISFQLGHPE